MRAQHVPSEPDGFSRACELACDERAVFAPSEHFERRFARVTPVGLIPGSTQDPFQVPNGGGVWTENEDPLICGGTSALRITSQDVHLFHAGELAKGHWLELRRS